MKSFEVEFGNNHPYGLGTHTSIDLTILATDVTDAFFKATEALDSVKEGLVSLGMDDDQVEGLRVTRLEELNPVINPNGRIDINEIGLVVQSMKEDLG